MRTALNIDAVNEIESESGISSDYLLGREIAEFQAIGRALNADEKKSLLRICAGVF